MAALATYTQVNLGFVNAYVIACGNEAAIVNTGDALNSSGALSGPNSRFSSDMKAAVVSAKKLGAGTSQQIAAIAELLQ